jgi:hypothetical protein
MNDCDQELFEAELRKLAPARPPAELMARLTASGPAPVPRPSTLNTQPSWRLLLRWLAPAGAVAAVVVLVVWWPSGHEDRQNSNQQMAAAQPALKADNVEFDQQLVASFDAVARLPSGQPVRFRCREWADAVVLRDSASGIEVEQRTPRLEVVPVSFETY